MSRSLNPGRWTKVQIALVTGINSWCALYLESPRQIAGIAVLTGAYLIWLAPNSDQDTPPEVRRELSGN